MNFATDYYMGFDRRGFVNISLVMLAFFMGSLIQGMFSYGFSEVIIILLLTKNVVQKVAMNTCGYCLFYMSCFYFKEIITKL